MASRTDFSTSGSLKLADMLSAHKSSEIMPAVAKLRVDQLNREASIEPPFDMDVKPSGSVTFVQNEELESGWNTFQRKHQEAAEILRGQAAEYAHAVRAFHDKYISDMGVLLGETSMALPKDFLHWHVRRYTAEMKWLDVWRYGNDLPLVVLTKSQTKEHINECQDVLCGRREEVRRIMESFPAHC